MYDNGTGYGAGYSIRAGLGVRFPRAALTFRHKVKQILAMPVGMTYI